MSIIRGGERKNSGRKKLKDPKHPLTIYVHESSIKRLGGREAAREYLVSCMESFNNQIANPQPTEPISTPKTNPITDTKKDLSDSIFGKYEDFEKRILATTMISEIRAIEKDIKVALLPPIQKNKLITLAVNHSKDFFEE